MITKTLDEVIGGALADPEFMENIMTDPASALRNKEWQLTVDDMNKLGELVGARKNADAFMKGIIETMVRSDTAWVPPQWIPKYPYTGFPGNFLPWNRK